jgi:hypothetical protein
MGDNGSRWVLLLDKIIDGNKLGWIIEMIIDNMNIF